MKQFNNICLIGTSHVAEESIQQIKKGFNEFQPDIVALELDNNRVYSLKHKVKRPKNLVLIRSLGISGFLFYLFGEFTQNKIGKLVNIEPGSDMLTALDLGEKNNCLIALIDRNIQITLKRFSKHFKKKEIIRMIFDVIKGVFSKNELGKFDFSKLPSNDVIEYVIEHTKQNYPSLYKILIDERDMFMTDKLLKLSLSYPEQKILAIVGAGHVKGIISYLDKETFK